jgi:2-polyprenyl-3-methyl-5-hydroxy-6-metoxy-1,4-benzoquinol methylase
MRPEYIDRIKVMGSNGGYFQSPVLDVGGGTTQYQKNQSYDMRDIMSRWNLEYFCLDIEAGDGVDIVDDACEMIKIPSNNFGTIICTEMLEHVANPFKVIDQCYRVLKPGGVIFMSAPFVYPVHSPQDYWRFTEQGVRLLMKDFEKLELRELGNASTNNHETYFIGRKNG